MMRTWLLIAVTLSIAPPAGAQTRTRPAPRPQVNRPARTFGGYVNVDGIYQTTTNDFLTSETFTRNAEAGQATTTYTVKAGPAFNVDGGLTVGRHIGVGVGLSRFSVTTGGALSAAVPHPFFFNQPRQVSGNVAGLTRKELALHVQARATAPVGRRVQVTGFGGPSSFQVTQGVVTNFTITEQYPYDTAALAGTTDTSAKASKVGYNVGADVAYFFAKQVGVGGTVQFSGATIGLSTGTTQADVKAGGLQVGGGLRLRF